MLRRIFVAIILAFAAISSIAYAQGFPSKPIHLIVPYPPGGSSDIIARMLAETMRNTLGQPIVVENQSGASGAIAAASVARAAPDGHTLLIPNNAFVMAPHMQSKATYNPESGFTPISMLATGPALLMVHSSVAANTVGELIAYAKDNPGRLEYATSSAFGQLVTEDFARKANVKMLHVPYKGGGPATIALATGEVKVQITPLNDSLKGFINEGKIKVLGSTFPIISPLAPGARPVAEVVPDYKAAIWHGILAPAGTPTHVVARLNTAVRNALETPGIRDQLMKLGLESAYTSPETFAEVIKSESRSNAILIKRAGIKAE